MNKPHMPNDISDWKLERYLLGELPRDELDLIQKRIETDPLLSKRLEALKESNENILERYPASWMGRAIRTKVGERQTSGRLRRTFSLSRLWPLPALPVAAVLLLLALMPALFPPDVRERSIPGIIETTRFKGTEPELMIYRKTDTGSERLEDGALAGEGDLLLVQYIPAGRQYGAIVSVDGRGKVTRHLPVAGKKAAKLEKGGPVPLDYSYELDDAPSRERFYFITSDEPFELNTVIGAIRQSPADTSRTGYGLLELPDGLEQSAFSIEKEEGNE